MRSPRVQLVQPLGDLSHVLAKIARSWRVTKDSSQVVPKYAMDERTEACTSPCSRPGSLLAIATAQTLARDPSTAVVTPLKDAVFHSERQPTPLVNV
jgi:hypothetical protein